MPLRLDVSAAFLWVSPSANLASQSPLALQPCDWQSGFEPLRRWQIPTTPQCVTTQGNDRYVQRRYTDLHLQFYP